MSQHQSKKKYAVLDLNDEDLAQLYFLLCDEIDDIQEFCCNPNNDPEDLVNMARQLKDFREIQKKLKKYFDDNHIQFHFTRSEKEDLASRGIETNL